MKRATTWLACIALFTTAAGCGTAEVRNSYEGPDRAGAAVAVLFTPQKDAYPDRRPRALFSAVDGRHYGTDMDGYPAATRVLPGTVLIKVNCTLDDAHPRWDSFLLFHATLQAGHYYELVCDRVTASALDRGTSYESIRHLLPETVHAKLVQ